MISGERIRARLEAIGKSQADLARAIAVSPQAISKMVTGETTDSAKLYQIARFLRTSPEFLSRETDDPEPGAFNDRRLPSQGTGPDGGMALPGIVMVKEIDLVLGFGASYLDVPVEERMIPFPEDWLRQFSRSPVDQLVFLRGRGESMKPTLLDGDLCLVDLSRKRLDEQDELWAVAYGEIGMIKRLRRLADGTVRILSDNPVVPEELATDGELFILGRCCGVFRKT